MFGLTSKLSSPRSAKDQRLPALFFVDRLPGQSIRQARRRQLFNKTGDKARFDLHQLPCEPLHIREGSCQEAPLGNDTGSSMEK
jgi:hypothetical protein